MKPIAKLREDHVIFDWKLEEKESLLDSEDPESTRQHRETKIEAILQEAGFFDL